MIKRICSLDAFQVLIETAVGVLDNGTPPEALRKPVDALRAMAQFKNSAFGRAVIEASRDLYMTDAGDIEIDEATLAYHNGETGYWVMAWCFVPDEE